MSWEVNYSEEFVGKFRELGYGQKNLIGDSIRDIISSEDPRALAHHLERKIYYCSWSHRVRANLVIVFRVSKRKITFISTGTHSQAYRPRS
ncbi:MAG: hypothetical protein PXY39_13290 [archaeon]|nr:hypothetical protein [archaeon]